MADEQDRQDTARRFGPWHGLGCLVLIGLALFIVFGTRRTPVPSETEATQALLYLKTAVAQVAWDEVTSDDVYIGLSSRPDTLHDIVGSAAVAGDQATGHAYTAWAVDSTVAQLGWRPGDPGLICQATASDGRVQSNTCPAASPQ
jgi:hypothetical protein